MQAASLKEARVEDTFWTPRLRIIRRVTIPRQYEHLQESGRLQALKLTWREGDPNPPHVFWDSDVGKWLEAVGYLLAEEADEDLEAKADEIIDLLAAAQAPDGYLNSYFLQRDQYQRWKNLRDHHELYCAGHLIEAAVAYFEATGKRRLLDIVCRYADHIAKVFGTGEDQLKGYPGHAEIELALIKLFRTTGTLRYLELAAFFIDERGQDPSYFQQEAATRSDSAAEPSLTYYQAHLPVRQQEAAEGHAVRACYLYAGMVDVAVETGDAELLSSCRRIWENLTTRRMYITGGIGSSHAGERFTFDYDLPPEAAYAETCAAISLVFFARRMLEVDSHRRYADVMERALYNGILSGISQDGERFFYVNPLAQHPAAQRDTGRSIGRQSWFDCACCPPNLARLFASLNQYIYTTQDRQIRVHLYISGQAMFQLVGQQITLTQKTFYPWDGHVQFEIGMSKPDSFALSLRLPEWCRRASVLINNVECTVYAENGYIILDRCWTDGDSVELDMEMPIERITAHPNVRHLCGKVAIQRGPIVYCLEEADNGENLYELHLPADEPLLLNEEDSPFAGVPAISGFAMRRDLKEWKSQLYQAGGNEEYYRIPILAIPYAYWANRGDGEMVIWMNRG